MGNKTKGKTLFRALPQNTTIPQDRSGVFEKSAHHFALKDSTPFGIICTGIRTFPSATNRLCANGRMYNVLHELHLWAASDKTSGPWRRGYAVNRKSHITGSGPVVYWVDSSAGEDSPWIAFLPGLTADHTLFDAQMTFFSSKANCFVWDAPAHGKSRPYALDFNMDDYARILHDILENEDITRPVHVGQSLAGYVSQAYMDLFPDAAAGFAAVDFAPLQKRYMKGGKSGLYGTRA